MTPPKLSITVKPGFNNSFLRQISLVLKLFVKKSNPRKVGSWMAVVGVEVLLQLLPIKVQCNGMINIKYSEQATKM